MLLRTSLALACLSLAVACAHAEPETKTAAPASSSEVAAPVHKAPTGGVPDKAELAGTVAEAFNSAQYTYMRVTLDSGDEVWAAASAQEVKVGARVQMRGFLMRDFHASSLDRTFAEIYFVDTLNVVHAAGPGDMI